MITDEIVEFIEGEISNYRFHADDVGLVWKKVDANGGEHLWRYDDSRQLLAQTDPLGNSTLYKYCLLYTSHRWLVGPKG